jgi:surface antigen
MAIGETEVLRRIDWIEGGKFMRRALRLIMLSGALVLGATCAWATGMNPFGASGMPLTDKDFAAMAAVADPLMEDETIPIGTSRSWNNPRSGNSGTITLEGRFSYDYQGSKLPCRKLRYHTVIKNYSDPYNLRLNRCRTANGDWMLL